MTIGHLISPLLLGHGRTDGRTGSPQYTFFYFVKNAYVVTQCVQSITTNSVHQLPLVGSYLLPTLRERWLVVTCYRRFWAAYRSQGHSCTACPLQVGTKGCPETSVTITKLCVTFQESENLKSRALSRSLSTLHRLASSGREVPSWNLGRGNDHHDGQLSRIFPRVLLRNYRHSTVQLLSPESF
jgi:hypothetical protein